MALRKRGRRGTYQMDIVLPTGERVRVTTGTNDRKAAEEIHRQTVVAAAMGEVTRRGHRKDQLTLQQVYDLLWKSRWQSSASASHVRTRYEDVADILGRSTPVAVIDMARLVDLVAGLRAQGNGPATINRKLAVVCTILTYACRDLRIIPSVPRMPRQEEDNERTRVITPAEELDLLQRLQRSPGAGHKDAADLFAVLLDTGARLTEVLSLEWTRVYLDERAVLLTKTKGKRNRGAPMTQRVHDILSARATLGPVNGNPRRGPWDELMVTSTGTLSVKAGKDRATRIWTWVRKEMGLEKDPEFVIHSLRHTCGTRLFTLSKDLRSVQKYLGHQTLKMTERYEHISDANKAGLAALLDAARGVTKLVTNATDGEA